MVERLVIRPLGRDGVVVVDDRQDARADRDLLAREPLRIALAVPSFVVAEDQRRDRIRERHRRDDLRADLRVNADLLELLLRQRSGLRQDVLGHRQLADVVQQRRGLDALDLVRRQARGLRQPGRVHLHAPDVRLRRLILRVDRARQRFDRRQVQIRRLLHVPLLVLDPAHVDLVGAIGQVDRRERERRHPVAGVGDDPHGERGAAGADEIARRAPEEVRVPGGDEPLRRVDSAMAVATSAGVDAGSRPSPRRRAAAPARQGPLDRACRRADETRARRLRTVRTSDGHAEQRPMHRRAASWCSGGTG